MKPLSQYKHLFFDLDDTLSLSKTVIDADTKELLERSGRDVIVVSGAENARIAFQSDTLHGYYLGQNGNHAIDPSGAFLWQNDLTEVEKTQIMKHASQLVSIISWPLKDETDLIEDRGCQISLSIVGHHEDVPYKKTFDPHSQVRLAMMERFPFENNTTEVKIGGTTTFDYFKKGAHKGSNVAKLIATMGWAKADCVYFGDKLHPGGNDETVVGVIDTIPVSHHRETFDILKAGLAVHSDDDIAHKIRMALSA